MCVPLSSRSLRQGPHLHLCDTTPARRTLVPEWIRWHRPCQPRHVYTVREPPNVHREPLAPLATRPGTHRPGTAHQVPGLGGGTPRSPRRRRLPGAASLVRGPTGHLLESRHRVVRRGLFDALRARARRSLDTRSGMVPGATLNYAEHALRAADTRADDGPPARRRDPRTPPGDLVRAAPPGRLAHRRAACARRTPGRPRERLSPERSASRGRPARHGRRGRRMDVLRPRLRRPQCPRPLPTGRTGRAVHRRRLPLRRQGARPPRHGRRTPPRTAHPPCRRPHPAAGHRGSRRHPGMVRPHLRGRDTRLRTGRFRPPPVGALLLRHDRPPQGHRPVPGRHPRRAPQTARPALRPGTGGPLLLVHVHRLDDVELPCLRPPDRHDDRPVRRQSRLPRHRRPVADR